MGVKAGVGADGVAGEGEGIAGCPAFDPGLGLGLRVILEEKKETNKLQSPQSP